MERFIREQKIVRESMSLKLKQIRAEHGKKLADFELEYFELATYYTYSFSVGDCLGCEWYFSSVAKHYQRLLPAEVANEIQRALAQSVIEARY
ncbi:MAG: hypothetical protein EOO49_05340 [Flavobacterium sp.]|nr:MAG: hypothetical protein EOO49_05340 [Flavobacterium sp.]